MIYIATVHWKTDKWIDIQLSYLKRFIKPDFRVFAFLNSLPLDHSHKFYYSSTEDITSHAIKLNLLADLIIQNSTSDDDWIIFLDGDAFPIGDIIEFGETYLEHHPLLAVRRDEHLGEKQPHPCFCLTTVKFWKEIMGDWNSGYEWKRNDGNYITDVGGNLLKILEEKKINWFPLLRTNKINLNPLLFGVYDDLIYHHGAGFRTPIYSFERLSSVGPLHQKLFRVHSRYLSNKISHIIPLTLKEYLKPGYKKSINNIKLSKRVYELILEDSNFFKYFVSDTEESKVQIKNKCFHPPCVVILGMHRSGTSCLAGILENAGVYMGHVNSYNRFNVKGTKENTEIVSLNDEILALNGGSWQSISENLQWNSSLAHKRDQLINKLSKSAKGEVWGFKDPRTLLTLPFWMEGLKNVRFIATFRHPAKVAKSLSDRKEISLPNNEGYALWEKYNLKLLELLEQYQFPLISFDLDKNDYIKRVETSLQKLNLQHNVATDFYEKSLINHDDTHSSEIPGTTLEIYNKLKSFHDKKETIDRFNSKPVTFLNS